MKIKRIVALGLSLVFIASAFAGCKKENPTPQPGTSSTPEATTKYPDYLNPVGEYPITKEKITLTVLGQKDPGATNWGDLEIFKRLSKQTNIDFEFQVEEGDTFTQKMNLALAGGKYPDLILRGATKTQEETYGPQGIFLDLTKLIDEYAPNLKSLIEKTPEVKASITALDGQIYGLPYYFKTATTQGHLGFFDSAWMKNVGIDKVPETTDELYTMLKAFKEKDANGNGNPNDEIPFSGLALSALNPVILPAFTGMTGMIGFDIDDAGKVLYVPAMKEYKDFLLYSHRLYKEGLLDPEFSTQTSQQWQAKVKEGTVGVYSASPTMLDAEKTKSEQLSLSGLTSPTNTKKAVPVPISLYTSKGIITSGCKYPEAAMRLLDMFYATEENAADGFSGNTAFLGYQGEHWDYTDNTKAAYSFIDPIKNFGDINKLISVNMSLPGLLDFGAMPEGNPLMKMKVTQVEQQQKPFYKAAYPVNVRFTTEESDAGNTIENDLLLYVTQKTTKFIVGEEDIEKGFDNYIKELENIGLSKLLKIKEDALVRWNAAIAK